VYSPRICYTWSTGLDLARWLEVWKEALIRAGVTPTPRMLDLGLSGPFLRDELKRRARSLERHQLLVCPICQAGVTARCIVAHCDEQHPSSYE
jgi:hypothetical protein